MRPLVIAHRGDSAHRPENTLSAFASALEVGAEIVELDVQLTRDDEIVVLHDDSVDRTTSGKGKIRTLTLAEVRSLSAGYADRFGGAHAGERVPTLAEALGLLRNRARVMIEIKKESVSDDAESGVEARTVEQVRRAGMVEQVAFLSFDRRALERCRRLAPNVTRGHLFYRAEIGEVIEGARAVGSELVLPEKGMLSKGLVERAQAEGLKVATWVVDDPEELRALARFDLYGVGSNRPGALLDALNEA